VASKAQLGRSQNQIKLPALYFAATYVAQLPKVRIITRDEAKIEHALPKDATHAFIPEREHLACRAVALVLSFCCEGRLPPSAHDAQLCANVVNVRLLEQRHPGQSGMVHCCWTRGQR
jgi:hypothetical protein